MGRVRPAVLAVAGSDPSGGAGVQADLKTLAAHGVYGMAAVTALTAQNTLGVTGVWPCPPEVLAAQLEAAFSDIVPAAVKLGMLGNEALARTVGEALAKFTPERVVADPVMRSSSGAELLTAEGVRVLREEIFPRAALITPNLPEAEALTGRIVASGGEMERAARRLSETYGCAVLCKGGHKSGTPDDFLWWENQGLWLRGRRVDNPNAHGTGCTLSSAIAANLARGLPMDRAVARAKEYLTGALAAMLDLGQGNGPLDHGYALHGPFFDGSI